MVSRLEISDAAGVALALGNSRHAIRLTVAAELRRLVVDLTQDDGKWPVNREPDELPGHTILEALTARANELDPPA